MKLRDELAAHVLERTECACAVVVVVGGEHNGYGIQAIDNAVDPGALAAELRRVAEEFERLARSRRGG